MGCKPASPACAGTRVCVPCCGANLPRGKIRGKRLRSNGVVPGYLGVGLLSLPLQEPELLLLLSEEVP